MKNYSKVWRSCVVIAFILLVATSDRMVLALAFQQKQEANSVSPFAAYPQTTAFRYATDTHVDPTRSLYKESQLLFSATFFLSDSDIAAEHLQIFKNGHVFSVRSVYSWAEQAVNWAELTSPEQGQVSELIGTIGQVGGKPPLVDLLIVSFSKNGTWTTVLLDRNRLPESIGRIYALTKARSPIRTPSTPDAAP